MIRKNTISQFYESANPVNVIESDDYLQEILQLLSKKELQSTVVIASKRFFLSEQCAGLRERITKDNFYTEIDYSPSFTACRSAIEQIQELRPFAIVGIGGGSALDMAKIIRMGLYKRSSEINRLFEPCEQIAEKAKLIAIPTTHGSGSEMTPWATIWNKTLKKKFSLSGPENYPDYAIYDAGLLCSLPPKMAITTSLDALSHSFEALWNKNATKQSDEFAYHAIELITKNFRGLIQLPVSNECRRNLQLGAHCSALAFSITKTAAAHAISYPLTAHFNVPHGVACSMPLQPLLELNSEKMSEKIAQLKESLGMADFSRLWSNIRSVINEYIPYRLKDYNVSPEDLDWLSDLCFTKDRMENNINELNQRHVLQILKDIY